LLIDLDLLTRQRDHDDARELTGDGPARKSRVGEAVLGQMT
jgi:hypothetical protein